MRKYFTIGAVVQSIQGRDSGQNYIISDINGNFAYLINGKTRPIKYPKKKNMTHLQLLKKSCDMDLDKVVDANIVKYLKDYKKSIDCK